MGICFSSSSNKVKKHAWENDPKWVIQKMKVLQQEINVVLKQREEEGEVYERELMEFACREAEWKRERKKLRAEVKWLAHKAGMDMTLAGKFEKGVVEEEYYSVDDCGGGGATFCMMEQMRVERARRDQTIEKWKMLYLAIKHELDDLILRTHQGTLYWRTEEQDKREDLQRKLKEKDETIEVLKTQLASMEDEQYKSKREVDILRQSLRIMGSNKKVSTSSAKVMGQFKASKLSY